MNEPYVDITGLVKEYPNPKGDPIRVVDRFNLSVQRGEFIGLIGHSGCGKSTVLTMVAGLNDITSGSVIVDGRETSGPGPDRAVVFQSPCLLPWMTAYNNVMLGVKRVYPTATQQERHDLVCYYMNRVGLADSMDKYPGEMSGGMQQRVGIARAIALKPKVLLLDEPFGRLDSLTRMELQDVILQILSTEKITTLMVTHDPDEAVFMCDRICMMTNGPRAKVGQIVSIPFGQNRVRADVLSDPRYYDLRVSLIDFLDKCEKEKEQAPVTDSHNPYETTLQPQLALGRLGVSS